MPLNDRKRIAIEGRRHHERFTRMPHHRHFRGRPVHTEQLRKQTLNEVETDRVLVVAVRQITIAAINIAETGRLDHDHRGRDASHGSPIVPAIPPIVPAIAPIVPAAIAPAAIAPATIAPATIAPPPGDLL